MIRHALFSLRRPPTREDDGWPDARRQIVSETREAHGNEVGRFLARIKAA